MFIVYLLLLQFLLLYYLDKHQNIVLHILLFLKKGNERLFPTKRPTLRYHEQRNSSGAKSNHYGTLNGKLIACLDCNGLTKVIMFPLAYIKQLLHLLSAETAGFAPTFFAALRSLDTKPKVE